MSFPYLDYLDDEPAEPERGDDEAPEEVTVRLKLPAPKPDKPEQPPRWRTVVTDPTFAGCVALAAVTAWLVASSWLGPWWGTVAVVAVVVIAVVAVAYVRDLGARIREAGPLWRQLFRRRDRDRDGGRTGFGAVRDAITGWPAWGSRTATGTATGTGASGRGRGGASPARPAGAHGSGPGRRGLLAGLSWPGRRHSAAPGAPATAGRKRAGGATTSRSGGRLTAALTGRTSGTGAGSRNAGRAPGGTGRRGRSSSTNGSSGKATRKRSGRGVGGAVSTVGGLLRDTGSAFLDGLRGTPSSSPSGSQSKKGRTSRAAASSPKSTTAATATPWSPARFWGGVGDFLRAGTESFGRGWESNRPPSTTPTKPPKSTPESKETAVPDKKPSGARPTGLEHEQAVPPSAMSDASTYKWSGNTKSLSGDLNRQADALDDMVNAALDKRHGPLYQAAVEEYAASSRQLRAAARALSGVDPAMRVALPDVFQRFEDPRGGYFVEEMADHQQWEEDQKGYGGA